MAESAVFLSEPRPGRTFFLGLGYTSDATMNGNLDKIDAALGELFVGAGGAAPEAGRFARQQEEQRESERQAGEPQQQGDALAEQERLRAEASGEQPLPGGQGAPQPSNPPQP